MYVRTPVLADPGLLLTCLIPGWTIARPGLHFAHPGNVERPTQTRGYFCIMNHIKPEE